MARARHSIVQFDVDISQKLADLPNTIFSHQRMTAMRFKAVDYVARRLSRYIKDRSITRHKSAERLGAQPTGTLDFSVGNPAYTRRGGMIRGFVQGGVGRVEIKGVAGIARAFRNLIIRPRRAKALTIPIDKESYAHSARQMEERGWSLYIKPRTLRKARGTACLWGSKGGVTKPLYALLKRTMVKRDPKLLPAGNMMAKWAADATAQYLEAAGL